jgi:hypothetical protein
MKEITGALVKMKYDFHIERERERERERVRTLEVVFLLSRGDIACGEQEKHLQVPHRPQMSNFSSFP